MEKEITSSCYQLPPLELLDEYASEGNVVSTGKTALDEKVASERKVVPDEEIAGKQNRSGRLSGRVRCRSRTSKPYRGRR